ncbi:MAG: hypothetical protein WCD37_19540 [Chloroflexia bacterium]
MTNFLSEDIFGLESLASEATSAESESQWLRENFALPYNPFPPSGISPDNPEGPPLRDQQGHEISGLIGNFILSAYRNRGATQGLVVTGSYGTGKSHILRLMHNQINKRLGSGEEKALSIYVQRPRIEAQDLNREVLRSLGEDTVRKMIWYCIRGQIARDIESEASKLRELETRLVGPLFAKHTSSVTENDFTRVFKIENLEDYRVFFEAYDSHGWQRGKLFDYLSDVFTRTVQLLSPAQVVDSFVTLLIANDVESRESWESLLTLGQRRKVPLLAAPEFLQDLLRIIQLNGHVYTFLLIDEFEEVPAGYLLTRRQKADYMYTLMEILNKINVGLGLVLAITPEAWEVLTDEAPPLGDRLPTVIRLGALDTKSMIRLLQTYLEHARNGANLIAETPIFPFNDQTISTISAVLPERTPRNVLQFAHQLISYCALNKIKSIDEDTIRQVLVSFLAMKDIQPEKRRLSGQ